jgi:large subunit ribosomal protein L29
VTSKAAELRELPDEELYVRIEGAKEELFNLRFQLATGQLDNSSRLKQLRHDVARMLTVLRERHLEAELEAELARVEADVLERSRAAQDSGELEGTPLGELEREALDDEAAEREDDQEDKKNEEEDT